MKTIISSNYPAATMILSLKYMFFKGADTLITKGHVYMDKYKGTGFIGSCKRVLNFFIRSEIYVYELAISGTQMGLVLALSLSGLLADALGWTAVFYVSGSLTMIWFVFWVFLCFDRPSQHPRISEVALS